MHLVTLKDSKQNSTRLFVIILAILIVASRLLICRNSSKIFCFQSHFVFIRLSTDSFVGDNAKTEKDTKCTWATDSSAFFKLIYTWLEIRLTFEVGSVGEGSSPLKGLGQTNCWNVPKNFRTKCFGLRKHLKGLQILDMIFNYTFQETHNNSDKKIIFTQYAYFLTMVNKLTISYWDQNSSETIFFGAPHT